MKLTVFLVGDEGGWGGRVLAPAWRISFTREKEEKEEAEKKKGEEVEVEQQEEEKEVETTNRTLAVASLSR